MEVIGGVDIGGTKIRWITMDRSGILSAREIPTPKNERDFKTALYKALDELKKRGAKRIGIGVPGTVHGSRILTCHNLPFLKNIDLAEWTPAGISIKADNDARCFARAEAVLGAGRGAKRLLAMVFGTGVGRGLTKNGIPIEIPRLSHAEKWEKQYRKMVLSAPREIAEFLSNKLLPLIDESAPDAIVIGGGLMRKPDMFSLIARALRARAIRIPIRRSRFHQNAGGIGAALLWR